MAGHLPKPDFKVRRLAILAANYPSPAAPTRGTFVREFARAVARNGVACTVVSPTPLHRALKTSTGYPSVERDAIANGSAVLVLRPRYVSLSARAWFSRLGPVNPGLVTLRGFRNAVLSAMRRHEVRPDAIYGHFLYLAGSAAVSVGSRLGVPTYPGVGEGELWTIRPFGVERARRHLEEAAGFVAVSSVLGDHVAKVLGLPRERFGVFPNGVDTGRFTPMDRSHARERLGLPQDLFLVGSAGNFLEKKGVARVANAIDGLDGVGGAYAGAGPVPPVAENTVLCRPVPHEDMPSFFAACDVFALPSVVEGSSNVLVEAMACGVPVISSNGSFNDDILSDDVAIRIDPMDVAALRTAIKALRDDPERRIAMSLAAQELSRRLNIDDRAKAVVRFMEMRATNVRGVDASRGAQRTPSLWPW